MLCRKGRLARLFYPVLLYQGIRQAVQVVQSEIRLMPRGPDQTPNVKLIGRKRRFLDVLTEGHVIDRTCALCDMSRSTYYNWRSNDQAFSDEADQILADPVYRDRLRLDGLRGKPVAGEDWRTSFCINYAKTGSRKASAIAAGVTATHVDNSRAAEHDDYDSEFDVICREIETLRLWEIEDEHLERAKTDSRAASEVLAALMPDKYGRSKGVGAGGVNLFWFNSEGESGAQKVLDTLFSSNLPPAVHEQASLNP